MPEMCEHKWVKNGRRSNRKSGLVQRWVCSKCNLHRNDYEHDPRTIRLRALALLANRLSFDQAEYLTGLKSETIHKHLTSVVVDPGARAEARERLSQLGLADQEVDYLLSVLESAAITSQRLQPAGPMPGGDLSELKSRIEALVGGEVEIGTSRQGVRVCRKRDLLGFIREMRKLPFNRLASRKPLSPKELMVLRQLHSPNAKVRLLSRLRSDGIEIDPVTRRPLPTNLTMSSLADGLNMDAGIFTGIAVALARKLKRVTSAH